MGHKFEPRLYVYELVVEMNDHHTEEKMLVVAASASHAANLPDFRSKSVKEIGELKAIQGTLTQE